MHTLPKSQDQGPKLFLISGVLWLSEIMHSTEYINNAQ